MLVHKDKLVEHILHWYHRSQMSSKYIRLSNTHAVLLILCILYMNQPGMRYLLINNGRTQRYDARTYTVQVPKV